MPKQPLSQKPRALAACLLVSMLASAGTIANTTPELVFTAPPRGTADSEAKTFQPVADYLSRAIGRKVVYRHIDNWLSYQSEMQKGKIDIIFDGPHFLSWRMHALQHEPLAKLQGKLGFVAVVREDDKEIREVSDLAGLPVCALAPPNLATLTVLSQFDNPARQPRVVNTKSFKLVYERVVEGKCRGGILRDVAYKKMDSKAKKLRIIYQSDGIANQAFSAGPRLTAAEKQKIAQALLAPQAKTAIKGFFERYSRGKDLMPAKIDEYRAHARLLKDVWGFDLKTADGAPAKPPRR